MDVPEFPLVSSHNTLVVRHAGPDPASRKGVDSGFRRNDGVLEQL